MSPIFMVIVLAGLAPADPAASPDTLPVDVGRLRANNHGTKRPNLFVSQMEIARARRRIETDDWAAGVLNQVITNAEEHLEIEIKPLDESWWDPIQDKPWTETYPPIFQHTWIEPMGYAQPAAELATAWMLTHDQRYADKGIALLMNLAPFSCRMEHFDVGMNYSIWGVEVLRAYDILLPEMKVDQRGELDALMSRLAEAVAKNDVYWIENNIGGGINNHLSWHKTMIGLIGLFYERDDFVDYCLHGRRGLISLLEDGLLDDGLWCESSLNYQFAAIAPMILLADCQRRVSNQPGLHEIVAGNGRTLKQSFDAMFAVLAPNCLIPPIGDAYGRHVELWRIPQYEICWDLWREEKYAWLIQQNPDLSTRSLFGPPVVVSRPPPIRSLLLPEHGYAFLRSHRDEAYWHNPEAICAFLTFDRSGVHANADKLSLMLFGRNRMLLSDVEGRATTQAHAFSSDIQRELNRGGLSQNTVMIDGHDQRYANQMLRLVEYRDLPHEKRVTAADESGILYDNVHQMRTIALAPEYVLDVFQVSCGTERQIDWIAHVLDETAEPLDETKSVLEKAESFALPEVGPWRWLRDATSLESASTLELGWKVEDARLRLRMPDPGAERVIVCGYPSTDALESETIPMILVRRRATEATFVAVWLIGDRIADAKIRALPDHDNMRVYEVRTETGTRRHLVPKLRPAPKPEPPRPAAAAAGG